MKFKIVNLSDRKICKKIQVRKYEKWQKLEFDFKIVWIVNIFQLQDIYRFLGFGMFEFV